MSGDDWDWFREKREQSQEKRERNREKSPALLDKAGVSYVVKNDGAHLIVEGHIDFWPGTGLWMDREGPEGRGVFNLIKHLGKS